MRRCWAVGQDNTSASALATARRVCVGSQLADARRQGLSTMRLVVPPAFFSMRTCSPRLEVPSLNRDTHNAFLLHTAVFSVKVRHHGLSLYIHGLRVASTGAGSDASASR